MIFHGVSEKATCLQATLSEQEDLLNIPFGGRESVYRLRKKLIYSLGLKVDGTSTQQ
jgi:hypothetical protein